MLRLTLDTNTAIAGFLWAGAPAGIIGFAERGRLELLSCPASYSEFRRVIAYPRIQRQLERRYFSLSQVFREYERLHTFLPNPPVFPLDPPIVADDPDDDLFYLLADAGGARYVVTRDDDLHRVREFNGVQAVDPVDFIRAFRRRREAAQAGRGEWGRRRWRIWRR